LGWLLGAIGFLRFVVDEAAPPGHAMLQWWLQEHHRTSNGNPRAHVVALLACVGLALAMAALPAVIYAAIHRLWTPPKVRECMCVSVCVALRRWRAVLSKGEPLARKTASKTDVTILLAPSRFFSSLVFADTVATALCQLGSPAAFSFPTVLQCICMHGRCGHSSPS